jgi:hypothetical protein
MKKNSPSPEVLGILNDEVRSGVGAATLLSTLGPLLDQRLDSLLFALESTAPDLNNLLDLRARISVVRSLKRELAKVAQRGVEAGEQLSHVS